MSTTVSKPSRRGKKPAQRRKGKTVKLTRSVRERELQGFINICFAFAKDYGYSPADLARRSGLSKSTIYNLIYGRFSLYMRVNTLQSIGGAVGLQLQMDEYSVRVRVA